MLPIPSFFSPKCGEREIMSTDEQMLEELREIRKLLTPKEPKPPSEGFINEFWDFLSKYKVLGLAVAFILGIYLGALVKSLVDNMVMPIVEIALIALGGGEAINWEEITFFFFRVGPFMADLLTFIIVAFVIFLIVKLANRVGVE